MKAPDIEHKVKRALDAQVRQLTDIPFDKRCSWCVFGFLTRLLNGDGGKIDPGGLISVASSYP
jgi:hypothetical protein